MSARKVIVEMTVAQASALVRLAECASNTHDDAMGILDTEPAVRAGMAGIDLLNRSLHHPIPASHRAVIFTPGQERALWTLADMTLAGEVDLSPSELAAGVEAHRKLRTDR